MKKQDVKFLAVVFFMAAAIFLMGAIAGYVHVIVRSEAYCVDNGDTLMLVVDGHEYQYLVSPKFYERRIFSGYDAHKFAEINNDWQ